MSSYRTINEQFDDFFLNKVMCVETLDEDTDRKSNIRIYKGLEMKISRKWLF